MKLAELTEGIGTLLEPETGGLDINHLTHDSQKAQYGSIFVAIEGSRADGHEYIGAALQLGAVCVMTNRPEKVPCHVPIVQVEDPRKAMALIARRLNHHPDRHLRVIGITGTNGKTTFTYVVNYLLQPLGRSGRIGTLSYYNGVSEEKSTRTTPESSDMYRSLGEMVANQCRYASMEISSHGLTFERVLGLELRYAVFSNLSHDHLDFHGDMESYFAAKHKQFDLLMEGGVAVINWDDPYGRRIKVPERASAITYGRSGEADLRFEIVDMSVKGTEFDVFWKGESARIHIPLIGAHNVYNFTSALAVVLSEGRPLESMAGKHPDLTPVPGRMELLDLGQDYGVIIDFAHTPDALDKVLLACKETRPRKLITVFGAGGGRDAQKRPEMGRIVDKMTDVMILTSDNPRFEAPETIMDMIQEGVSRPLGETFFRDWDRREAITQALNLAQPGDLVLIAGRGHETTQEINGTHHPFNDRFVAAQAIQAQRKLKEAGGNV